MHGPSSPVPHAKKITTVTIEHMTFNTHVVQPTSLTTELRDLMNNLVGEIPPSV